jgi:isoamylase
LPKIAEYKSWQQVLNTTEAEASTALASGAESSAPPRSVLAFAGVT